MCKIENEINRKNEGYFEIIMHNVELEKIVKYSGRKLTILDIKENTITLRTKNLIKLLKRNEKLDYNFTLDYSKVLEEIEMHIYEEICMEYNKELGL